MAEQIRMRSRSVLAGGVAVGLGLGALAMAGFGIAGSPEGMLDAAFTRALDQRAVVRTWTGPVEQAQFRPAADFGPASGVAGRAVPSGSGQDIGALRVGDRLTIRSRDGHVRQLEIADISPIAPPVSVGTSGVETAVRVLLVTATVVGNAAGPRVRFMMEAPQRGASPQVDQPL
ncbi:MAG: hypothetical protein AB7E70_07115 [Hyphomicrobiaceae bacterium]